MDEPGTSLQETIYRQLRVMAGRYMAGERRNHTLQPTALVNEAYIRLAKDDPRVWDSRRPYFFREAGRIMRQILVDHARRRNALKRGGGRTIVNLETDFMPAPQGADVLDLNDAMERLASLSQRQADVIDLRYWSGLNVSETAEILGVSERTVKNDTRIALAWLRRELKEP